MEKAVYFPEKQVISWLIEKVLLYRDWAKVFGFCFKVIRIYA